MKKNEIKAALARLDTATRATESALAAELEMTAMRGRVSDLRRITTEADTDAEAEAAAAELVPLAERVRVLEVTAPRRQAAITRARAEEKRIGVEILAAIEADAVELDEAATAAGFAFLKSFSDPASFDGMDPATAASHSLGKACFHLLGVYPATKLLQAIRIGLLAGQGTASHAREILEGWEAQETAIRAAIARLEKATPSN